MNTGLPNASPRIKKGNQPATKSEKMNDAVVSFLYVHHASAMKPMKKPGHQIIGFGKPRISESSCFEPDPVDW